MASTSGGVPPGFRFHPTDEELLHYYLKKKVSFQKFEMEVIREVDLNNIEPWDLQGRCRIGSTPQNEWYLFSHKDKKYPTGSRTNRATSAGFWKATGRDKCIRSSFKKIGMRKTLVFYLGRAPHGQKTDWIMHEYRLEEHDEDGDDNDDQRATNPTEDGWVVCRVFKKKNPIKVGNEGAGGGSGSGLKATISADHQQLISGSITPITTSNDHRTAARGGGVMDRHRHLPYDLQLRHGHGAAYAGCQQQSEGAAAAFEFYKYKPAPGLALLHHHHYDPPGLAHISNGTDTDHDLDVDRRYRTHHDPPQAPLGHQGLINNNPGAGGQYDKLNSNMGFDFSTGLPLGSDDSSIMINKQQAAASRDQREASGSKSMRCHQAACEVELNDQDMDTSYEPSRHQYQQQQQQRIDVNHGVAGRTRSRGDDQQLNEWNNGGPEGSVSVPGSSKGDASNLLPPQLNHLSLRSEMDFWAPAYVMASSDATTTATPTTATLLPDFKQTLSMD